MRQQIIAFIKATVRTRGYPPSVREIGAELGLSSPSSVHHYIDRMVDDGLLRREPGKPRTLSVVESS